MIKRVKQGYQVLSTKGKNLGGPYGTSSATRPDPVAGGAALRAVG
jgi:hypothetical protein